MISRLRIAKENRAALPLLLCVWVLFLGARVTAFSSGGIGAWLCVIGFWMATVMLLAFSIEHLLDSMVEEKARYIFVVVGVIAFCYRVFMPSGAIAELSTAVWLLCVIGLFATYIRSAVQRRRHAASH